MNNLKKIFFLIALSIGSFSFAQENSGAVEYGTATMDANYCVALDSATPVQNKYVADATNLGWTSAAHATKKCGYHSNNLISFVADYDNNQMIITIHTDRTKELKDIVWWNAYLESLCK